jgi:hypothetical protein
VSGFEKPGPLDHVARPRLPWRHDDELTECGKRISGLPADRIITYVELAERVTVLGQQRAAYTTCMTCWDTSERHRHARAEPIQVLRREIEGLGLYPREPMPDEHYRSERERRSAYAAWARHVRLQRELEAIAALVEAHRPEFDEFLAGREEAVDLASRRQRRPARGTRVWRS